MSYRLAEIRPGFARVLTPDRKKQFGIARRRTAGNVTRWEAIVYQPAGDYPIHPTTHTTRDFAAAELSRRGITGYYKEDLT